jgi:hypothetical protein
MLTNLIPKLGLAGLARFTQLGEWDSGPGGTVGEVCHTSRAPNSACSALWQCAEVHVGQAPLPESSYAAIKSEQCSVRRTHCDWTVVGPVT